MPSWIWAAAILGAAIGDWILYDVSPGINWPLWTAAAALGLGIVTARRHGRAGRPVYLLLGTAVTVTAGTPMTTDQFTHNWIFVITGMLLGTATLLAAAPDIRAIRPALLLRVPFRAPEAVIRAAAAESIARGRWTRSTDARPVLRGALIALPCIVILGLLLASADPTLASWRDAIANIFPNWDGPQTIFVVAIGAILLGAYAHAAKATALPPTPTRITIPNVGTTELRIVLGSVATLLALFIVLQIAYLFGGADRLAGTGVTYAEYAHRGYAELTIAAGIVIALVLLAEHGMTRGSVDRVIRPLQYVLLGTIVVILASALHRITLYESVYGYTTLRLHARVFAGLMLCTVACVALQVARGIDLGQLSRQLIAIGLITFIGLTWWNDHAWIARHNLARATMPDNRVPLDAYYLSSLSDDAAPAVIAALPTLTGVARIRVEESVAMYVRRGDDPNDPWYAWNYRRSQARAAYHTYLHGAK